MNHIFRQIFKSQPGVSLKPQYQSSPNPVEMLEAHLSEKKYQGLLVDWEVIIQNMYNDFDPNVIVVLTSFGNSKASVWLSVKGETNPEIFDHGSGSRVKVKGEVNTIQGNNIYLENCHLQF
jgi:hypothetical protein